MNKILFIFLFVFLLFFAGRTAELKIICTADLHGEINRFAELAAVIRSEDDGDVLKIDLGDLWQGNFISEYSGGRVMMDALNSLGFHFAVPGNHDFECSSKNFISLYRSFAGTVLGGDWNVEGFSGKPWAMVTVNGIKCAVIGLTDSWMTGRMIPGSGMRFASPYNALAAIMPEILDARPDVVILVWHAGIVQKGGHISRILRFFPEINIVFGAHTHEEHPGVKIGESWFVQPGCRSDSAAVVTVKVDPGRSRGSRICGMSSRLIRRKPGVRDPETAKLADRISQEAAIAGGVVISHDEALCRRPEKGDFNSRLGDLCAASVRRRSGADAALCAIRVDGMKIRPPLTVRDVYRLMPYRNEVWKIEVTLEELCGIIEAELNDRRKPKQLPFVSGGIVTISGRGEVSTAPAAVGDAGRYIVLAVSDYLLFRNRVLNRIIRGEKRAPEPCGFSEAEAVIGELTDGNGRLRK